MATMGLDHGDGAAGGPRRPVARSVAIGLVVLVLAGAAVAIGDAGLWTGSSGDLAQTAPAARATEMAGVSGAGGDVGSLVPDAPFAGRAVDGSAALGSAPSVPPPAVGSEPVRVPGTEPRVVKHADLDIEVEGSATEAFDRVTEVARSQGGFVVSSSTSSTGEAPARAELTLRVPAERFDAARAALAELGEVRSLQVGGDDVTAQLVDLDARLRALRAEEDALNGLLAEAGDIGEVLAVREQLSATRLEIEQLAAQQASLDDRATFSTLRVVLSGPGAVGMQPEPGLANSLERALDGAVTVVGGMVVVLGYAGPILVLGLLAWAGQRVVRLSRRPA